MFKAFGIVNSSERNIHVEGLQDYRAIGAFSFLGRYRVIDFPISNMTKSGIEYIQLNRTTNFFTDSHIESGADVTMLYHSVDNAKENYLNCHILNLNRQKGVLSIEHNHGNAKNRNIFMDTYVMSKELFISLIHKAKEISSLYTLADVINAGCRDGELDVRGISHRGYFASITNFRSYHDANMDLIDYKTATDLFHDNWPIYTRTNNSCPTHYFDTANVSNSVISNGSMIEGTVENSIVGRGCTIKKGAVRTV